MEFWDVFHAIGCPLKKQSGSLLPCVIGLFEDLTVHTVRSIRTDTGRMGPILYKPMLSRGLMKLNGVHSSATCVC